MNYETLIITFAEPIRTLDDFMAYYEAGVTRQGTRAAAEIVDEAVRRGW